jgi:hypothetical protein
MRKENRANVEAGQQGPSDIVSISAACKVVDFNKEINIS